MAEDDDDEIFGDFSFAPNIPYDDDEWGDFVQQSKPAASHSFSSNGNVLPPPLWVKPSGALPLSIFGDTEEEDKDATAEYASTSEDLNPTNLYKQTSNDPDSNSTIGLDLVSVENGFHSSSKKKNLESVVLDPNQNAIPNGVWNLGFNVETLTSSTSDMNDQRHESDGEISATAAEYALANDNLNFAKLYHQTPNGPDSDIGSRAESVSIENDSKKMSDGLNVLDPNKNTDLVGWWNLEFNAETLPSSTLDKNGHKKEFNGVVANSIVEHTSTSESFNFANSFSQTSNGPDSYFHNRAYPVGIENGSNSSSKKKIDESNVLADQNTDLFGRENLESNVKTLSSSTFDINGQEDKLDGDNAFDDGDDGWEFKDAYTEFSTAGDVNNKVDFRMNLASEGGAYSSGSASGSNKMHDLFGSFNESIDLFAMPNESVDLFATSGAMLNSSQEVELTNMPTTATPNGSMPDTFSKTGQDVNSSLETSPDVVDSEYDEDFGEFTTAPAETVPMQVENYTKLNNSKGALPLSIFGDEGPNYDGSSDIQDTFLHISIPDLRNSHPPTPVVSVNDLISSLYSQAEQPAAVGTVQNPTTIELILSNEVSNSSKVHDGDYLDNSSWDFKDAYNESSPYTNAESHLSISSKLKLNDCLDFYSKLKEELCLVAKCHIKSIKDSRSIAAFSGEDATVEALDRELQMVCMELEQMNEFIEENSSQDHPSGVHHLNELTEVLLEPKFQKLESEYQLSVRLSLVEKDLMSAIELLRHANTMLKIQTIGTSKEQSSYISMWSDMIAVCAQELKHGAMILNLAVEKNVESHLRFETQGCKFVLALGEIYRVAVVLGASAKLFKPWTVSGSLDSSDMNMLLEECHTVWSTSGLEEALSNVSVSIAPGAVSLLKSIKHIRGLDAPTLQDYLFTEKESLCWLSILPAGVAPGLKMITWGEEQCFITLANLWANLISPDPPNLSRLHIG